MFLGGLVFMNFRINKPNHADVCPGFYSQGADSSFREDKNIRDIFKGGKCPPDLI